MGADAPALPELRPRQQATLSQLLEAWKERPDKLGLEGWVRLARARAEDLGKPERQRHGLVDAVLEQAILERLGDIVLPESARAELKQQIIQHLLLVPDGVLYYLPLGIVRLKGTTNSTYLIEQYAVSSVPALTTLEAIRKQKQERAQQRKQTQRELLAFAHPDFGGGAIVAAKDELETRLRSVRRDYYTGSGLNWTPLPETTNEALRAAAVFAPPRVYSAPTPSPEGSAVVLIQQAATEEMAKQLLGWPPPDSPPGAAPSSPATRHPSPCTWRYVLFATHGLADTHNGMLSCLALSAPGPDSPEDGYLQAQEVMNLELDTDLVMLSACETGLGRLRGGEGLVGLSAAFFYAGAESVCASLWQVPSGPTTQLSSEFFRHLKEGRLSRAEALRQAQLSVLRSEQRSPSRDIKYADPFCWAAFVLMGEYKVTAQDDFQIR